MKRIITAVMLTSTLLLSSQVIQAEDKAPDVKRHSSERVLERMSERLNLTEEQQQNIKPVLDEEFEKMRTLREESRQKIESYLTDEQKQQFEKRAGDRNRCKDKRSDD